MKRAGRVVTVVVVAVMLQSPRLFGIGRVP